eukprot:1384911-Amorphochlora_amoeboformis.AAC.1
MTFKPGGKRERERERKERVAKRQDGEFYPRLPNNPYISPGPRALVRLPGPSYFGADNQIQLKRADRLIWSSIVKLG